MTKEILINKRNITREILECTIKMNKAIEQKDTQKITQLVNIKQKLIKKSEKIDVNIKNIKTFIKQIKDDQEMAKVLDEITKLFGEIRKIDNDNIKKSGQLAENIKTKISDLKQTGNAMRGYGIIGNSTTSEGAFIDMKQ